MSESSTTKEVVSGSPEVSKVSEAVIRIAGNSQDGIQSIGGFLALLAGRSEQEVRLTTQERWDLKDVDDLGHPRALLSGMHVCQHRTTKALSDLGT